MSKALGLKVIKNNVNKNTEYKSEFSVNVWRQSQRWAVCVYDQKYFPGPLTWMAGYIARLFARLRMVTNLNRPTKIIATNVK